MSVRLEIDFYKDLHLITFEGDEFVLVDQSTEELEDLQFLREIRSQPIIFEEFVVFSFLDFAMIAQADLHYSMHVNLVETPIEEAKYVERAKERLYI